MNLNSNFLTILAAFSILFIPPSGLAMPILITFPKGQESAAARYQDLIESQYKIPGELISQEMGDEVCIPNQKTLLHLCLDREGFAQIVVVKEKLLRESLHVFQEIK